MNVVPRLGMLATEMVPLCNPTIDRAMARPNSDSPPSPSRASLLDGQALADLGKRGSITGGDPALDDGAKQ